MYLHSTLSSVTSTMCGLLESFCCGELTTVSGLIGLMGLCSNWLVVRPCTMQRSLVVGWQGWVMKQFTAEFQWASGLVLAHYCVE